MKQDSKDNIQNSGKRFVQLAADNKKVVMAVCLIAVMIFMWIRVLTSKSPDAAKAESAAKETDVSGDTDSTVKVSYVELPKVEGRNDVITRDFFASNGWHDFYSSKNSTDTGEVNGFSGNDNEEVVKEVIEKLKLEAIGLGDNPRALINNKMMSVGEKLQIREGMISYECEVVQITADTVVIKCGETEVTLKLIQ